MASSAEIKLYIETVGPIAKKICAERGLSNANIWTCLAQGACESAWGTSSLMRNANALFGIKATQGWINNGGKFYKSSTKECYDGSTYVSIVDAFRAYDSVEESVRDYFDLLTADRYKACLGKNTVEECITEIKKGGYATSPTYITTICNIYNAHRVEFEQYNLTVSEYDNNSEYYDVYKGNTDSIVNILNYYNEDSSFAFRKKLALKNKIVTTEGQYLGTATQNLRMVALAKAGLLLKL